MEKLIKDLKNFVDPITTLVDEAIEQITEDVNCTDIESLCEMLQFVPQTQLSAYLRIKEKVETEEGKGLQLWNGRTIQLTENQTLQLYKVRGWIFHRNKKGEISYDYEYAGNDIFTSLETAQSVLRGEITNIKTRKFHYKRKTLYAKVMLLQGEVNSEGVVRFCNTLEEIDLS